MASDIPPKKKKKKAQIRAEYLLKMELHLPPKKTFAQIQEQWNIIPTLDPRNKVKAMRAIAHDLERSYDRNEVNSEQVQFYLSILKFITDYLSYDGTLLSVLRSKMIQDQLRLSGHSPGRILLSKKGEIGGDCPSLHMGDPFYSKESQNAPVQIKAQLAWELNLINEGKVYQTGVGSDDSFYIELRLVDSLEPCLASKEMKFVKGSTETVIMSLPTGVFALGYPSFDDEDLPSITVAPGNYKMSVFYIYKNRDITLCFVLCSTTAEAKNNYKSIHNFAGIDW